MIVNVWSIECSKSKLRRTNKQMKDVIESVFNEREKMRF